MMDFQIFTCPDDAAIGRVLAGWNSITIGRSEGDLILQDQSLLPSHMKMWVTEMDELMVAPSSMGASIAVGGKRISEPTEVEEGSTIQLENTTLQVMKFEYTPPPGSKRAKNAFKEGSNEKRILEIIEEINKE